MSLRRIITDACQSRRVAMKDLTVLSAGVDPYRLDTPAGRRDGQWAAEQLVRFYGPDKRVHWRGLHYAITAAGDIRKPNSAVYINADDDWDWLSETAGKAARWLGYIRFDRIIDQRNAPPVIHRRPRQRPHAFVSAHLHVEIPDVVNIEPRAVPSGFVARQAYQFVIFGEKSSLEDIVAPIAREYEADLYLPTGEISDTLIYMIARDAAADGRPLVLFTLSDCDPSGHQMLISITRKLQAFRDLFFPALQFEVVRAALTPDQVRTERLPETPLKDGEKRAGRWREAFGVEQTEIDALTIPAKAPILRTMIRRAFAPYIDQTLQRRVTLAELEWRREARDVLAGQVDREHIAELQERARSAVRQFRADIAGINEALEKAIDGVISPAVEVPAPEIDIDPDRPSLVSFADDWVAASRKLITHKSYGMAPTNHREAAE